MNRKEIKARIKNLSPAEHKELLELLVFLSLHEAPHKMTSSEILGSIRKTLREKGLDTATTPKLKKYSVRVRRSSAQLKSFEVEASNVNEAGELACELAAEEKEDDKYWVYMDGGDEAICVTEIE